MRRVCDMGCRNTFWSLRHASIALKTRQCCKIFVRYSSSSFQILSLPTRRPQLLGYFFSVLSIVSLYRTNGFLTRLTSQTWRLESRPCTTIPRLLRRDEQQCSVTAMQCRDDCSAASTHCAVQCRGFSDTANKCKKSFYCKKNIFIEKLEKYVFLV